MQVWGSCWTYTKLGAQVNIFLFINRKDGKDSIERG